MTEKEHKKESEKKEESHERLAFPEACIVRIMKKNMDKEKMIKKEVKVAMNHWLKKLVTNVSKTMNSFPYVMMTKSEFNMGVKVYETLEEFQEEKERILSHLDAMKKDIGRLEKDLGKTEQEVLEMS